MRHGTTGSRLHLSSAASALILAAMLITASCGCESSEPEMEYSGGPAEKPFPSEEVAQAKVLVDQGSVLYTQAINSMDQDERNSLANEALDRYFRPAQEILDRLAQEYPEHAGSIDSLQTELVRKIDGAIKITGF
jgi:hypothetical protein